MSGFTALLVATLLTIGLLAAVPTIRWSNLRDPRLAGRASNQSRISPVPPATSKRDAS
jgi:hypothetical protein